MKNQDQPVFNLQHIPLEEWLRRVTKELEARKGIVLIADPKYPGSHPDHLTGEFEMHLFGRPTIDLKEMFLVTKRGSKKVGGVNHQTGWECDRLYRLHKKPQPRQPRPGDESRKQFARLLGQPSNLEELYDQARTFFQRLEVGAYNFEICFQPCPGHTLERNKFSRWRAYYIPHTGSPRTTMIHALTWMTNMWNAQKPLQGWQPETFKFTPEHIEAMADYAAEDLKTGAVLRHNVQAGSDADAFVGLS